MATAGSAPLILVADDEPAITLALQLLFELRGLPADVAGSADATLRRVAQGGVGVVVHDMNFTRDDTSGADGLALFRGLRRLSPRLPVILITSWPGVALSQQLLEEGAVAVLAKPWDDDELVALVRRLL